MSLIDPEVSEKLTSEGVLTQFYALRWIMLLMCQEFEMPNCVRLWDTLLANNDENYEFLNFICASVVIKSRETIINGDFAMIMETLQGEHKSIPDVSGLL